MSIVLNQPCPKCAFRTLQYYTTNEMYDRSLPIIVCNNSVCRSTYLSADLLIILTRDLQSTKTTLEIESVKLKESRRRSDLLAAVNRILGEELETTRKELFTCREKLHSLTPRFGEPGYHEQKSLDAAYAEGRAASLSEGAARGCIVAAEYIQAQREQASENAKSETRAATYEKCAKEMDKLANAAWSASILEHRRRAGVFQTAARKIRSLT